MAGLRDITGDGRGDLLVRGPDPTDAQPRYAGAVFAYSGADGAPLFTFTSPHDESASAFASLLSGVPDVDGDAVPDLVFGGPEDLPGGLA